MIDQQTIPSRFSEASFRQYEDYIKISLACVKRGSYADFKPCGSAETLSCRLRDAMKSFKQFNWTSTIDYAEFFTLHEGGQLKVSVQLNGNVYVGKGKAAQVETKTNVLNVSCPTENDIAIFEHILKHQNVFHFDQIRISNTQFSEKLIKLLLSSDIEVITNNDGTFTLI